VLRVTTRADGGAEHAGRQEPAGKPVKRLQKRTDPILKQGLHAAMYVAVPCVIYGVVRGISEAQLWPVRLVGLAVVLAALVLAVWVISTESRRQRLARSGGLALTLSYATTVAVVSAALFAGITLELVRHGAVEVSPTPDQAGPLVDFYMWHLINVLPGSILDTLRLGPPVTYEQSRVGCLVLIYTLVVATPVVALAREVWRTRSGDGLQDGH
jgi:hypothetical protein